MVNDFNVDFEIGRLESLKEERFQLRRRAFKYLREYIDLVDNTGNFYELNWLKRKMDHNYMGDINDTKLLFLLKFFKKRLGE